MTMTLVEPASKLEAFRAGVPGVYEGIPAEEYHSLPAASAGRLKKLARSPLHCRESIDHPGAPTPAMVLGSAEHCAVLQPELFAAGYIAAGECVATLASGKRKGETCGNAGKSFDGDAWWCDVHRPIDMDALLDPRAILSPDDYAKCKAMHAAVWSHPAAKKALAALGPRELSVLWIDKATGQLCKIRVDALGERVAWDVKTTQDASPEQFAWSVRKFKYDLQAAFYLRGLLAAGLMRDGFGFIAVESEPPHAVAVYSLSDEDLSEADEDIFGEAGLLADYASCARNNLWLGYSTGMQVLRLPSRRRDATID